MPGENSMPQDMGALGVPGGPPPEPAPSGTASGDVVPPAGEIEMAKAQVSVALFSLEKALPIIGSTSEEGKALVSAISTLSKKFSGKKSEDLAPAELMGQINAAPDPIKAAMMKEMGGGGAATSGVPTS